MKKFYIGFGVSAVLMIGGIVLGFMWNPKVDMAKQGKYFYSNQGYRADVSSRSNFSKKVVSADKNHIKIEVKIKDLSGYVVLRDLVSYQNYESKENEKLILKYLSNEFTDPEIAKANRKEVKTLKQEVIKYKWAKEPHNIAIAKSDVKLSGQEDRKIEHITINPIVEGGKVPLEGIININKNFSLEKDRVVSEDVFIYGKKGSGTLEIEIESNYK